MRKIYCFFLVIVMFFLIPLPVLADETSSEMTDMPESAADTVSGNDAETAAVTEQLRIDGTKLYEGMENTYEKGYIPKIENEKVCIILPLIGRTYDGKVTVTADLGAAKDSPFVFGNYSQTAYIQDGVYLFRFDIPLTSGRINGEYPVTLTACYLDATGNQAKQNFTIYVTVADGSNQSAGSTASVSSKEEVKTPKLYISTCEISPDIVSGEEEFTVSITIENIGAIRARSVLLSYGSDTAGIIPIETNNLLYLENIAAGDSKEASFGFKTTKDVAAGDQEFFARLDYADLFGGIYTENRTFLVQITQPAEMEYDPVMVPRQVISGEKFSVPVNVFNTGNSILKNVTATISGSGLFPTSSVFLGDILPDEAGNGEMEIYVGTISMTDSSAADYGKINGTYTIYYTDESGEKHREEMDFSTEIMQPVSEDGENIEKQKTMSQWWISVLAASAIIAIFASVIIVTKFSHMMRVSGIAVQYGYVQSRL